MPRNVFGGDKNYVFDKFRYVTGVNGNFFRKETENVSIFFTE
jgi:hypothetical protein